MPTVLLITGQDRVRHLFTGLERTGMFRLRVAPTLAQGEEEVSFRRPHYVFVENRIAGLAGPAITHHLRGLLPDGVEVILMARDAAEAAEFLEGGELFFLNLSESDEALRRSITKAIPGRAQQHEPPPPEPSPAVPRTARELLFDRPGQEPPAARDTRLLWAVPLVLFALCLGGVVYRAGRPAPAPAPQPPAGVALPAPGAAARSAAPAPSPAGGNGSQTAGTGAAPASETVASKGKQTYLVRPGDALLKILVREFGFDYHDALDIIPEFKRINNLNDVNELKPGQLIVIPDGRGTGEKAKEPGT